ncbi:MAG: hypothetical protein LIO95_07420 [Clostridiales bacterium]|nr:hypothetical protein [Clostridiales bacterium]
MKIEKSTRCGQLFSGSLRYQLLSVFWRFGIFAAGSRWIDGLTVEEACESFMVDTDRVLEALNRAQCTA